MTYYDCAECGTSAFNDFLCTMCRNRADPSMCEKCHSKKINTTLDGFKGYCAGCKGKYRPPLPLYEHKEKIVDLMVAQLKYQYGDLWDNRYD